MDRTPPASRPPPAVPDLAHPLPPQPRGLPRRLGTASAPVSFADLEKNWRDRLIGLAARHPDWVVGYADEVWWSRLAQPTMHAWGETLRLKVKARAKDDPQPKALAGSGLLRTDQDRVLLRFVEGRPVSRVTRAVANRPGSSAAALCRRPPGQPRHTGCCEPTRIECCCALSKAARSAASHGLLRTDQDRVLLRFVEGRQVS